MGASLYSPNITPVHTGVMSICITEEKEAFLSYPKGSVILELKSLG